MAPHDLDTVLGWRGATVIDRDGEKIGTLKELYLDQDDRPAWAAVETGLFGLRQSFVPLEGATALDDQVQVDGVELQQRRDRAPREVHERVWRGHDERGPPGVMRPSATIAPALWLLKPAPMRPASSAPTIRLTLWRLAA